MKYSINDDSVNVFDGASSHAVQRGQPNFLPLCAALVAQDWATARTHLSVRKSMMNWAFGRFTYTETPGAVCGKLFCDGKELPATLNERAFRMAAAGEDPRPLMRFWERLQLNPSWRSVEQLWPFLEHEGIPLTEDGHFLAYKGIKGDYTDNHTGKIDNSVGKKHRMERNRVSDDPKTPCHFGFHVGAEAYARTIGSVMVICRVDPADVVCIPYDCSHQKMRVCAYEVVGHHGQTMPSTSIPAREVPRSEPDDMDVAEEDADDDDDLDAESGHEDFKDDEGGDEVVQTHHLKQDLTPVLRRVVEDATPKTLLQAVTQVVGEATERAMKPLGVKVPRKFRKYLNMSVGQLLELPLGELRTFAANGLMIVGASKIPGGKTKLVERIRACLPKKV